MPPPVWLHICFSRTECYVLAWTYSSPMSLRGLETNSLNKEITMTNMPRSEHSKRGNLSGPVTCGMDLGGREQLWCIVQAPCHTWFVWRVGRYGRDMWTTCEKVQMLRLTVRQKQLERFPSVTRVHRHRFQISSGTTCRGAESKYGAACTAPFKPVRSPRKRLKTPNNCLDDILHVIVGNPLDSMEL